MPDWGHGPNVPVQMYTEDQLRAAFDEHWPAATSWFGLQCSCSKWAGTSLEGGSQYSHVEWSVDHFLGCLKEAT